MLNQYGVPFNGFQITLMDGEEVCMDIGVKSEYERIVERDCGLFWIDDRGCEIAIDDVYDCETETHYSPNEWFEEIKVYVVAYAD